MGIPTLPACLVYSTNILTWNLNRAHMDHNYNAGENASRMNYPFVSEQNLNVRYNAFLFESKFNKLKLMFNLYWKSMSCLFLYPYRKQVFPDLSVTIISQLFYFMDTTTALVFINNFLLFITFGFVMEELYLNRDCVTRWIVFMMFPRGWDVRT